VLAEQQDGKSVALDHEAATVVPNQRRLPGDPRDLGSDLRKSRSLTWACLQQAGKDCRSCRALQEWLPLLSKLPGEAANTRKGAHSLLTLGKKALPALGHFPPAEESEERAAPVRKSMAGCCSAMRCSAGSCCRWLTGTPHKLETALLTLVPGNHTQRVLISKHDF